MNVIDDVGRIQVVQQLKREGVWAGVMKRASVKMRPSKIIFVDKSDKLSQWRRYPRVLSGC